MKKLRFLPIALAVFLSSCVKSPMVEISSEEQGEGLLQIGLTVDESLQIVQTKADMDASLVPDADELYVDLYRFAKKIKTDKNGKVTEADKETWNRMYFGTYAEAKEMTMRVNAGKWKLLAFHGDSTACGIDKPYFLAEKEFTVNGGLDENNQPNITRVEAQAKVSNVRITVNYDKTVPGSFYDYFVRFTNVEQLVQNKEGEMVANKYKQIYRYKKGQTGDVYMMPTQQMTIEFMAQYELGNDQWKYIDLGKIGEDGKYDETIQDSYFVVNPNDHLILNLSVNPRNGGLNVTVTTDTNIVKESTDVEISETWAPQDAPQVVAAGFVEGDHAVVEGDNTGNGATVSVVARGGLKNFFFKVESDYLVESEGFDIPLGVEFDLANPTAETQEGLAKLKTAGFSWGDNMRGSRRLTYLSMTDLFAAINAKNPSLTVERDIAKFTIRVVDQVGKETVKELTATAYPITQTLSIPEGKVWATKIVSPELTVSCGVSRLFKLQISEDGTTWTESQPFQSANNSVIDYGTLTVEPNKTYHFRTIYNNNPNLMSNVVTVKTEQALQIGNPGFEEYQTTTMHVSPLGWLYDYDREWYLPYNEGEQDTWWAVNSKKTMPDGHTAWTSNFCKNFPCTAYSTDRWQGEKSAMVYTINVGDGNTDGTAIGTNVPGEIWIGKADNSGNHTQDGHAFASRPTSVRFMYKYSPIDNDKFVVYISLKDAAGNEIARSEKLDGASAAEWTECEIPVIYSNTTAKAASIYICFKSCNEGGVNIAATAEIAGKLQTAHIGSILRVDDVRLTY